MVQPALQDEPRRSRGVLGPSLAENRPKTGPKIRILNCQDKSKDTETGRELSLRAGQADELYRHPWAGDGFVVAASKGQ